MVAAFHLIDSMNTDTFWDYTTCILCLIGALHVDVSLLVESDPPLPKAIEVNQVEEWDNAIDEHEE